MTDSIQLLLEPIVAAAGLDLEAVDIQPAGKRRRVQVLVDRDGGVDLDTIADISRAISEELDSSNAMGDTAYVLEVSSPGVDRPLTLPRHWRRNETRLVSIAMNDGSEIDGRITSTTDTDATIETKSGPVVVAYEDVKRATIEIEFGRE